MVDIDAMEKSELANIEVKLREVDQRLRDQLRIRGFDPDQDQSLALTAPLARLYNERETLRAELEKMIENDPPANSTASMSEAKRLEDQLRRAFKGEAWHGPSVMELLKDVTADQAMARPLRSAHSIWEIVLHIAAWERAGLRRLHGDRAELSAEEDWPVIADDGKEAWEQTIRELENGHEELADAISRLDDSRLYQPIIEGMSTVYGTLHGIVQHSLYHAGQIALLKKAVLEGSNA